MTKKINALQFCCMFIIIIVSTTLGKTVYSLIRTAGVDSWLSVIFAFLFGLIIVLSFIYIFNYEPDLPINQKVKKLFGNTLGTIINYVTILAILASSVSSFYDLNAFISSQFLQETPIIVIGIMFVLVMVYLNIKGIEVISRVTLILIGINVFLYLFAVLGLLPNFELSNLKPFLEFGVSKPLQGSIYLLLYNILPVIMLLMIPKNRIVNNSFLGRKIVITYFAAAFIILSTLILTLGILGVELTDLYLYPEYVVLKRINFFNFIDRIENIIIIQWIFGLVMNISISIYFITRNVKKKSNNLIVWIVAFLIILSSNIAFKNTTIYDVYVTKFAIYIKWILLIIILLIAIRIKYKRMKKDISN